MAVKKARTPDQNSLAWRVKVYLQWTGWLQYIPNAVAALLVMGLYGVAALLGCQLLAAVLALIDGLLVVRLAFDLVTIKCQHQPCNPGAARRDDLDAFDVMLMRRSCRSFQPRNLGSAHLTEILEHARAETEPDRLLGTSRIRLEYVARPLSVWPVVNCHEFLVAIAPSKYDRAAIIDVGRSLQKVVLHATRMGLGTCWIGPGADHRSVIAELGERFDEARDHIVCVCAIGYASPYLPLAISLMLRLQAWRFPVKELFFASSDFREPLNVAVEPYSRYGRTYECCRWCPSSFNEQPTRCVGCEEGRRFDFYAASSSRWYAPVALGIWLANWEAGCQELGIEGRFEVLTSQRRPDGVEPVYDVSWLRAP